MKNTLLIIAFSVISIISFSQNNIANHNLNVIVNIENSEITVLAKSFKYGFVRPIVLP